MRTSRGYSTVLLALILSSCILASLAAIEVASSYAGKSIANSISSISGRSVLSEYSNELYQRYGLFAVKNSKTFLYDKFCLYVNKTLDNSNGIVHLRLDNPGIDTSAYNFDDPEEILRQIMLLGYDANSYIMKHFSNELNIKNNVISNLEVEYILYGFENDRANHLACSAELYAIRFALNYVIVNNEMNTADALGLTPRERLLKEMTEKEIVETIIGKAAYLASEDVNTLYSGGSVCTFNSGDESSYMDYEAYISSFLLLIPNSIKIDRMKNVIEKNINEVDEKDFSFESSCFGFDLSALYIKKSCAPILGVLNRKIYVKKSFSYK